MIARYLITFIWRTISFYFKTKKNFFLLCFKTSLVSRILGLVLNTPPVLCLQRYNLFIEISWVTGALAQEFHYFRLMWYRLQLHDYKHSDELAVIQSWKSWRFLNNCFGTLWLFQILILKFVPMTNEKYIAGDTSVVTLIMITLLRFSPLID